MKIKYYFFVLTSIVLCSCVGKPINEDVSIFYRKSWGSVYYTDKPAKTWGIHAIKIKGANAKTFIPLAEMVAKDKNLVYYRQFPQPQVDLKTFEVKEDGTMKDKDHIYFPTIMNGNEYGLRILYNVDLETYGSYKGHVGWGYDKNHVYHSYSKPIEADPASFSFLSDNFMKDKNFLYVQYFDGLKKRQLNTDSLIAINETYVRDNNHVYFFDFGNTNDFGSIPIKSSDDIISLDNSFIIIDNKVYNNGNLLSEVDAKTFRTLGDNYSRDTSQVFYLGQIIPNIDAQNFKLLTEGFASDKQSVYYLGCAVKGVDVNSFKIINSLYFLDKNHVYFIYSPPKNGKDFFVAVDQADPKTFYHDPRKNELYGADDKNEFYNGGIIIKNP